MGFTVIPLPSFAAADFIIKGAGVHLVEYKRRNFTSTTFPNLWIRQEKVAKILQAAQILDIGFLYMVGMDDGFFICNMSEATWAVEHDGRTDRGDPNDTGPMVKIDLSHFKRIG